MKPFHDSGSLLVASLKPCGPGSIPGQSMGELYWTYWHWDRVIRFSLVSVNKSVLLTLLSPNTIIGRISRKGRSRGTLEQSNALSDIGELWTGNYLHNGTERKELRYALLLT